MLATGVGHCQTWHYTAVYQSLLRHISATKSRKANISVDWRCEIVKNYFSATNIGEIHYHQENKTNGGKKIEFSAESTNLKKKSKV